MHVMSSWQLTKWQYYSFYRANQDFILGVNPRQIFVLHMAWTYSRPPPQSSPLSHPETSFPLPALCRNSVHPRPQTISSWQSSNRPRTSMSPHLGILSHLSSSASIALHLLVNFPDLMLGQMVISLSRTTFLKSTVLLEM